MKTQTSTITHKMARVEVLRTDGRASVLFIQHWVGWWAPVCALVGLPLPYVPGNRFGERVARALGWRWVPGEPYHANSSCRVAGPDSPGRLSPVPQFDVEFRRGFPESVDLSGELGEVAVAIRRWADALPLSGLGLQGSLPRDWAAIRGAHLEHVTSLRLRHCHTEVVRAVLESPHMARVDELTLFTDRARADWPAEQLSVLTGSLVAARVRRLVLELDTPAEATVFARPGAWPSLSELVVRSGLHLAGEGGAVLGEVLSVLAGADFLGRLESLGLYMDGPAIGHAGHHPAVEAGLLRLLRALDPGRLRFLDLGPVYGRSAAVSELVAERFGGKLVAP